MTRAAVVILKVFANIFVRVAGAPVPPVRLVSPMPPVSPVPLAPAQAWFGLVKRERGPRAPRAPVSRALKGPEGPY